ncbi:Os07g0647750 [Oryza sativa Japonica Group]|uniref:Os07g0647750 protein n=2 Tax=Oryza sativa TaxID=4530 RepID=A0A0P0X9E7_ORYSJ|nr:Os07g0647750 [Oryza sativa Japonica Group]
MEDFQPQLVGTWKELEAPQHWSEMRCPQLANLGSGRFCIARFFHTWTTPMEPNSFGYDSIKVHSFSDFDSDSDSIEFEEHSFTVLTGTDVVPCVHDGNGTGNGNYANGSNGKVELRMIKHNSKSHISYGIDGTIRLVF